MANWTVAKTVNNWTDEQWKAAFEAEGPFSWRAWYGNGFSTFKEEMQQQGAEFSTYTVNEGKCLDCTARVAITDLSIVFKHTEKEGWHPVTDREVPLMRFRDPCDCI